MAKFFKHKRSGKGRRRKSKRTAFQSRVLRLTVKQVALLVLLLVAFAVPVVFVNHPIAYIPLVTFLLVLALDFAYLQLLSHGLEMNPSFESGSCLRGGTMAFSVDMVNKSFLPATRLEPQFYVSDAFGGESRQVGCSTALMGRESSTFDVSVRFSHVGTYTAGLQAVLVFDPFGLMHRTLKVGKSCTVEITPVVAELASMDIAGEIVKESQRMIKPVPSEDMDYTGVRDYELGDSMKRIHWKLSARTDNFLTRLFETHTNPGVSLVVDFHAPYEDPEELMDCNDALLESMLSVERYARTNGFDTELAYRGTRGSAVHLVPSATDRAADIFAEMVDRPLPGLSVDANRALGFLSGEESALAAHGIVVFVTANPGEEVAAALLACKVQHRRPILLLVAPRGCERQAMERASRTLARLDDARISYSLVTGVEELAGGGAQ